jgi:hypothetical protein
MSFLAPDRIPFNILQQNQTPADLEAAIQANLAAGTAISAADGSLLIDPTQDIVVGDGNTVSVFTTTPDPTAILVTGLGTTVFINGPTAILGTNLGGGGVIIETVQDPDPDTSSKTILFSSGYSDVNGTVDTSVLVGGNENYTDYQTIADAAGNQIPVPGFTFYGSGGAGDDLLIGSNYSDFLRGGAGSDQISAGGGDDLVRGGAGSDEIFLGSGMDSVFYTSDQMNSTDTLGDFTSGEDKITFDSSLNLGFADFTGLGTTELTVSSDAGTVKIVSDGTAIQQDDIDFV